MKLKLHASINITPLVDVFLVLICILILAATVTVRSLSVNVPNTSFAAGVKAAQTLKLKINAQGSLSYLDSVEIITIEQVLPRIDPQATTVQIYADQSISYAQVAAVLDRISSVPPKEIQLITQ